MIPFFDLKSQYLSIKDEIDAAVSRVLESGWFVLGEELKRFEEEFAAYTGTSFAVGVGSGTEAVHLALRAAGVEKGGLVATVPLTAVATVSAIREAGAVPAFVDVDPETLLMDPAALKELLKEKGDKIKAILPVHLYGQCADMDKILALGEEFGIPVIEDSCQAHGAEYKGKKAGSIGELAAFSFYPSKNLGAYGDGGIITTDSEETAERLKLLRNYGQKERYDSVSEGINSRLDEMQAAVLSIKLKELDRWVARRRQIAALYSSLITLADVTLPVEGPQRKHAYHLYVIRHANRDGLKKYLEDNGVSTLIHYPIPIHLQGGYDWMGLGEGSFPQVERAAKTILSLPLYPELKDEDVEKIAALIDNFDA